MDVSSFDGGDNGIDRDVYVVMIPNIGDVVRLSFFSTIPIALSSSPVEISTEEYICC